MSDQGKSQTTSKWRMANGITDDEFADVGELLTDYAPRDLALMVTRLRTLLCLRKDAVTWLAPNGGLNVRPEQ